MLRTYAKPYMWLRAPLPYMPLMNARPLAESLDEKSQAEEAAAEHEVGQEEAPDGEGDAASEARAVAEGVEQEAAMGAANASGLPGIGSKGTVVPPSAARLDASGGGPAIPAPPQPPSDAPRDLDSAMLGQGAGFGSFGLQQHVMGEDQWSGNGGEDLPEFPDLSDDEGRGRNKSFGDGDRLPSELFKQVAARPPADAPNDRPSRAGTCTAHVVLATEVVVWPLCACCYTAAGAAGVFCRALMHSRTVASGRGTTSEFCASQFLHHHGLRCSMLGSSWSTRLHWGSAGKLVGVDSCCS